MLTQTLQHQSQVLSVLLSRVTEHQKCHPIRQEQTRQVQHPAQDHLLHCVTLLQSIMLASIVRSQQAQQALLNMLQRSFLSLACQASVHGQWKSLNLFESGDSHPE